MLGLSYRVDYSEGSPGIATWPFEFVIILALSPKDQTHHGRRMGLLLKVVLWLCTVGGSRLEL
jgi:hypothetical protein